jgi:hypothetical protein
MPPSTDKEPAEAIVAAAKADNANVLLTLVIETP